MCFVTEPTGMGYVESKTSHDARWKTKTKKKRHGKNLLQWLKEYEGTNFRESSIQLVIAPNCYLNLLILTIRNRPNDLYPSQKNLLNIAKKTLSKSDFYYQKKQYINISLTLEPNALLLRVQNEESSYLAGAILKTEDQIHELLRLVWTD